MLKIVVGLGNPGQQYEKTRHNVGFLFLDSLVFDYLGRWSYRPEFEAYVAEVFVGGMRVVMLKPTTFMNKSGASVGKVVRYYKIPAEEMLVVHDELDFDVGVLKLKKGGGHAGHNGLRDIVANLGSGDFYRLRVGVGRPVNGKKVAEYVLSPPSLVESGLLASVLADFKGCFHEMVGGSMAVVMGKLNASLK